MRSSIAALFIATTVLATCGCMRQSSVVRPAVVNAPSDNSYMDLKAGDSLRILKPITKSGSYSIGSTMVAREGTFEVAAPDLLGYEMSHYAIKGKPDGRVRLKFKSTDITKDGVTIKANKSTPLPFPLPSRPQHVRLIYFVRHSQADHNMAIVSSKDLNLLNTLPAGLRAIRIVVNRIAPFLLLGADWHFSET